MKKLSKQIDPIFGIPLSEDHAFTRAKAMKTLDAYQEPIAEHLILLFSAKPNSPDISGWQGELNAWRRQLVRRNVGKSGSKNFTREVLVNALWTEPLSTYDDRDIRIRHLMADKGIQIPPIEGKRAEEFKKFVSRYIQCIETDTDFKK